MAQQREVPQTVSRTPAPGPGGPKAPRQLAEQDATNEELVRRLAERTARIRAAIQQWRTKKQMVPGAATQMMAQQARSPVPMQPNPFMAPPQQMQAQQAQPGLPQLPPMR